MRFGSAWLSERHRAGIIVTTPNGDLADRLAIRRSGADIYLLKPVDGDELIQGVRNLARRIIAVEPDFAEFSANDWFFDPAHWTL